MLRIPEIVVGPVETLEDLLRCLGRQVSDPRQVVSRPGEVAALLVGPEADAPLPVYVDPLLQGQPAALALLFTVMYSPITVNLMMDRRLTPVQAAEHLGISP
ncbi:hypothetical protein [Streptomyces olivochromogenes]|uniref:Uncharacterized protein n=1 Tax=Streptomyces olivochromogenes TaxID=1963 RepID=A0A250V827_STROL|nr:hypothetical protein [Streptomyces olivochromogenes]KUN45888.1 hypothetical protein AQJ27_19145 [Streptomyces olivochromogenes]GAX50166.1 hypothetical protein SO3561_01661 [Streptomyces olivochromogenes]